MDRNYKVYVHINKVNGKRYYGITCQKVNRRWRNGKRYSYNQHFWNAINKYGWDNFEHIVIARGLTEEEAKWLEIELIREWDTTNKDKGYNISLGGDGGSGHEVTKETRKKISESLKGRTFSEEHRKNISKAGKGKHKGKNTTKIYCVELDMYFNSVTEAGDYVDCNDSNISSVLTGNNKTAGGYHWLYAEDVNEENINKVLSEEYNKRITTVKGKDHPRARKVYCVELDMTFDTMTEASKYVGCSQGNISNVLTGRAKTAGGYHWEHAEDKLKNGEAVYCVELDMVFDSIKEAGEYIGCSGGSISNALNGKQNTCGGYHWLRAKDVENKGVS